jgi:hypothetical protein
VKILLVVLLLLSPAAFAKSGGKGSGSCTSTHGSHGGGTHARMDARKAPPLATDRKVHEQDCSKPIDWTAGNVKCK